MKKNKNSLLLDIGWCEWVSFPALKIHAIEAQVVMESKQSILNIFDFSTFKEGEDLMISFGVHPIQDNNDVEVYSVMPVKTRRLVSFADGDREWCYVIETEMRIGSMKKNIDLTLVNREESTFRLHLAPQNIKSLVKVNPQKSYLTGDILSNYSISTSLN
ncbi:RimK/LysX family protein [uncultured Desulfuromusa sp.]|uniref:putative ATP-dependent zinc protease n=1 Tax=uncultured Desulfuromusa sp. TaxID=219183 RepID=UPI002AA5E923|nr:RimK/LysX family protein [uncultured Desulfuromusa sp.]